MDVVQSETSAPKAHVGGSPFNVAVGLARLEHDVVFAGRRGDDEYGRMIARSLRAQGITALLEADASPTSVARATLDPTGQASYEFTLDWTLPSADELEAKFCALAGETAESGQTGDAGRTGTATKDQHSQDQHPGPLEHLHAGSIGAMLQPGAETVKNVIDRAHAVATVSYDPNYRPTLVPNRDEARRQAEEFISRADIIQASTDDLDLLYPERSHRETMDAWLQMGPALVTVTRGPSGAMGLTRAGFAEQEAFSVEVADTVGAGDSFMAATLSTLRGMNLLGASRRPALREISPEQLSTVLRTAARAAAINSSRFGAQPPTAEELDHALRG